MDTIVQDVVLETSSEINLQSGSQQDVQDHKPVTLIYLQHLDCGLCRHALEELSQIALTDPDFSSMIFFHPGSVGDGTSIRQVWPDAPVIADQSGHIYRELLWNEEAFGQCLALTSRLDTAQDYAYALESFWLLPEAA